MTSWSSPRNRTNILREKKKKEKSLIIGKVQRCPVPIAFSQCSYPLSFIMSSHTFQGKRWQWSLCSNVLSTFISPVSKQWPWCNSVIKKDCKPTLLSGKNFTTSRSYSWESRRRMILVFWDSQAVKSFHIFFLKQLCGTVINSILLQ